MVCSQTERLFPFFFFLRFTFIKDKFCFSLALANEPSAWGKLDMALGVTKNRPLVNSDILSYCHGGRCCMALWSMQLERDRRPAGQQRLRSGTPAIARFNLSNQTGTGGQLAVLYCSPSIEEMCAKNSIKYSVLLWFVSNKGVTLSKENRKKKK